MNKTQPYRASIPIQGWRNSKGQPCALTTYRDGSYAAGAGWKYVGRFKGQAIYAPPPALAEAIRAGERPEHIDGVVQVPTDKRVLSVLARLAKAYGHHRYSEIVGPTDEYRRGVITGGVTFQGAEGGVYVTDDSGRYRKLYLDGAGAAAEVA